MAQQQQMRYEPALPIRTIHPTLQHDAVSESKIGIKHALFPSINFYLVNSSSLPSVVTLALTWQLIDALGYTYVCCWSYSANKLFLDDQIHRGSHSIPSSVAMLLPHIQYTHAL